MFHESQQFTQQPYGLVTRVSLLLYTAVVVGVVQCQMIVNDFDIRFDYEYLVIFVDFRYDRIGIHRLRIPVHTVLVGH